MAQHKASESALVAAARALDHELDELARTVDNIRRGPLTTQKQIERAQALLASLAPAEASVRARIAALDDAVEARNVALAEQLAHATERTPHIDARADGLQRLLDQYVGLGVRTTELARGADAELAVIVDETDALLAAAKKGDFPDIVRLAEALAKQLSARARHA